MTDCSWAAQKTAASCGTSAEALKTLAATTATTTSVTKTATIAFKALAATALNMIAFALIAQGISLVVKGLDNLFNATEKCQKRVDDLMDSYKSALNAANDNAKTVESLASRYETLSNGVNDLGQNVSLTTDEYKEYNNICNQIADMFPTLVNGYTDEGTAILALKGNVEQLRDAYKEAQKEAYRLLIVKGKDSDGNDILKNWQNNFNNGGLVDKLDIYTDIAAAINKNDLISARKKAMDSGNNTRMSFMDLYGYDDVSKLTEEEFDKIIKTANAKKQELKAALESDLYNVKSMANAYLLTNDDYDKLDKDSKNAASIIVNSIDKNIAAGFKDKSNVGSYVSNIVDMLQDSSNLDFKNSLTGLLTLDTSEMTSGDIQKDVNKYIDKIVNALGENPVDLKIRLGYEDFTEGGKIDSQITNIKDKLQDAFDDKVGDLSLENLEVAARLDVSSNSLLSWDELIAKIEEAKLKASDSISVSFDINNEDTEKSIDGFQSSLSSLSNALEKVKDNKLTGSELIDLQQQFPELIGQTDNLSEALTDLIDNTLTDVIDFLEHAGAPDDLIEAFRQLADEAKGISLDGWEDTLDVFDDVSSSMTTLAELTKSLGNDYTITATEARKFAAVFPELLSLGEITSTGLIKFNSDVISSFISGKESEVQADTDARIQELKNQKAVIEGKMAAARSELELLIAQGNAKIDAENQTSEGIAESRDNLAQHTVDLETDVVNANADANEAMAGYTQEYDRVAADVSGNVHNNLSNSIDGAATNVNIKSSSMIDSLFSVAQQAVKTAKSILSIGTDNPFEAVKETIEGAGNALKSFDPSDTVAEFKRKTKETLNEIGTYQRSEKIVELELDIAGFQDELSNIDSQIALLEASKNKSLKDYDRGSGGSGSGSKEKEAVEKEIDWIDRHLKELDELSDELESKASSSFLSYLGLTPDELKKARAIITSTETLMAEDISELQNIAQNAGMSISDLTNLVQHGIPADSKRGYFAQVMEVDKLKIDACIKAIDEYGSKYEEKAASLPQEIRDLIENNSIDLMDISTYSEEDGNIIQEAIDAYDKLQDVIKKKADIETKADEHSKQYYENNIEYLDQQLARLESSNSLINAQMDYLKESGQIVSAYSYEQLIANNKRTIVYYEQKIAEAKKRLEELMARDDFDPDSETYYELTNQIEDLENSSISAKIEVERLNNELRNLPIDNMDVILSMYDSAIDTIQRWGSEMEAAGRKVDNGYYQTLIDNGMEILDQYEEQIDLIHEVMDEYEVGSENWNTLYSKLQSINSEMSTMIENLHKWNEALLQMPLDTVSEYSSELQKVLDAMTGVQDDYNTVISTVTGALQEEIDLLKEASDLETEQTQAQIDVLQERLDLLNQQNEALKLQSAYEQALYDLQTANTQKTERVIRNGEVVFETNANNIKDAQESLQDALANLNEYNLEQEIEALQTQLDDVTDSYNDQIEALEKISEKWSQISEKIRQTKDEAITTSLLGEGWKEKVVSGNDDDIYTTFTGMYQTLSDQMTLYEEQIESTENIYALLEDYITAYKEGTITYNQAVTGINDILSQMNQKMSAMDNLENVLDYLSTTTGGDSNVDSILSTIQDSLVKTGDELIASFEQYNKNAALISEYTTSWQQLTENVSDIKDILEEVRDNLEDSLNEIKHSRDDDDDDDDDRSKGVNSSGTITAGVDHSNYGPSFGTESPQYASGIEAGLVGANNDTDRLNMLKVLTTQPIEDINNAVPIIAHKGEAVLNENQQNQLLDNFKIALESNPVKTSENIDQQDQAMNNFIAALQANPFESNLQSMPFVPDFNIPDYSLLSGENNYNTENNTYNIGDIVIQKCDNPDQLAQAILRGSLKTAALHRLGKRN